MKCPSCGKEINDMDMVCPNCGAIVTRTSDIFSKGNNQPVNTSTTSNNAPVNQGNPLADPRAKGKYVAAVVIGAIALAASLVTVIAGINTMFGGYPEEIKYTWLTITIISAAIGGALAFAVFPMGQQIYGTSYKPKGFKENLPVILAGPALFFALAVGIITFVLATTL